MMDISHNIFVTPKILSGSTLKIIATIAMVANHVGIIILGAITELIWFPMRINGEITPEKYEQINCFIRLTLYNMGNLAFPLFCLLVSEGYRYTHNREKYIFRMLLFAIISELPFDIGFFSALSTAAKTFPFYWNHQNVFFTYFLSLVCLYSLDKLKFVYRVVRFSVSVAFSVLIGRAGHPRLRDDVGIVPYAGGGMVWVGRLRTRGITGSGTMPPL